MKQNEFNMDRTFIQFSSLALVALCACTMLYYFFRNDNSVTPTRAPVPGGLVLCVVTCDPGHRDHALVRRGPGGSTDQKDVQSATVSIPYIVMHPLEHNCWPPRPFNGPYLAMVSTRPKNFVLRAAIRRGWGGKARYPSGAFRLIFFLAEPAPASSTGSHHLKKDLLNEAILHKDMAIESHWLSSPGAMLLEWAPEYASAPKLLLWARDDVKVNASDLFKEMQRLSGVPGDVFGRVSTTGANQATLASNARDSASPWNRLEQCAYFIKMEALVRLSSVYEDVHRGSTRSQEMGLVTAPLASRANLSLVAIDHPAKCH